MSPPTTLSPAESPGAADPAAPAGAVQPRCPHCGTAVEGGEDAFCCHGCALAAEIIRGAGLERYYREREAFAPRPERPPEGWEQVAVEAAADGTARARLVVDGLRCASCVWVTEQVLERTAGVREATVSYATGRATLRWDPARTSLAALAARIAALGYRPRPLGAERTPDRDLLLRLGVSAFGAANIMLLSVSLYAGWWGSMEPGYAELFRWTALVLATPVALWSAAPFFRGAWAALRHGSLHMDLPIALGVAILYGHGVGATLTGRDTYLDSLAMLVTLLLAGRMLEAGGRRRAAEAATALAATAPRTARRASGGALETVPADSLQRGDRIDVGAGEEFAADGIVLEGAGQVRRALFTGEAAPIAVEPGDPVSAGTVLLDGAVTVRVEAAGEATLLHQLAAQLAAAADRGARPSSADRIAPWFTLATIGVAAATALGWWLAAGGETAMLRTVAVLVVACPCALALAQPLAAAAGLGAAARRGLLFRSTEALLELNRVDTVVLDKTGTVTGGTLNVVAADRATLRIAAGLERYSNHPIARAIVAETVRRGIPLPRAAGVRESAGTGIEGIVDGGAWRLRSGGPGVVTLEGSGPPGTILLGDQVRADSAATIARLRAMGLRVALLTGDHPEVARGIAQAAGVDEVVAGTDPAGKAGWIARQRQQGRSVLFAGDGLNDGPALAEADVGIAMGSGAASSVLVADGVISAASLAPLLAGFRAADAAGRMIRASQRRSIVYNVLAVGAAAAGLVNPLVAAVLMPLSSGMVIFGATRVEVMVKAGDV